jgi:hypothetical protein
VRGECGKSRTFAFLCTPKSESDEQCYSYTWDETSAEQMTETEAESAKNIGLLQILMWLQYGPFHRITKQPTDQSFSTLHCCSFSRKQNVVSKKSSLSSSGLGKTQVIRSFVEVVKQSSRTPAPLSERSGSPASVPPPATQGTVHFPSDRCPLRVRPATVSH